MRVLGLRSKPCAWPPKRTERDACTGWPTDPLTRPAQPPGMQEALSNALRLCCHEQQLAVYLLDLDGLQARQRRARPRWAMNCWWPWRAVCKGHVRATDLVARLQGRLICGGGQRAGKPAQAHDLADKLLDAFHSPFTLSSTKVQVGLTIGYALAPLDADDAASLLKLADAAMYQENRTAEFRVQRSAEQLAMPEPVRRLWEPQRQQR